MTREQRLGALSAVKVGAVSGAGALVLLLVGGCGGSASETPFPQPPIERELAARHAAAAAGEEATELEANNAQPGTAAATPKAALSAQPPTEPPAAPRSGF